MPITLLSLNTDATEYLFRRLMTRIAVLAGLMHCAFALLFALADVVILAWVNVVSVLCYVAVFWAARTLWAKTAWSLAIGEIVLHAMIASYLIGWNVGFHWYVMLIPPVIMVSPLLLGRIKLPAAVAFIGVYIGLDVGLREHQPLFQLDAVVINTLYYFNLVTIMAVMVLLAAIYFQLVVNNDQRLRQMAITDPLTKLHNRRSIESYVQHWLQTQTDPATLSFLLCDLDHFKHINDVHGHHAGDQVLVAVANVLQQSVREQDMAARWGGEEFLLMLPDVPTPTAMSVAERIRAAIESLDIRHGNQRLPVSVSVGVCTRQPKETFAQSISRADRALYQAKDQGRNCVVLDEPKASV